LILPKGHEVIPPGDYDGEFGIVVGYDKQIGGQLVRLIPRLKSTSSFVVPEKTGQVKPA